MIEIPVNNEQVDVKDELTTKILKGIEKDGYAQVWWSDLPNKQVALEVANAFVEKGYHARANYFCESWKGRGGLQFIEVSKKPCRESMGRLVYTDILG